MNKHKKNLEELKRHLGRDKKGLDLLDEVARDLVEQRKLIAALDEAKVSAVSQAANRQQAWADAQTQIAQLKAAMEKEIAKRVSAEHQLRQREEQIVQLEAKVNEADAELDQYLTDSRSDDSQWSNRILQLFKDVRRHYRRVPASSVGGAHFIIEDLLVDYTMEEFAALGKLVTFVAMCVSQVSFASGQTKRLVRCRQEVQEQVMYWLAPLVPLTRLESKVCQHTPPLPGEMV